MNGHRGGIQRRAPIAPVRDEVSVSGFSTPRRQSGRVYEQTIYGKNLHKINRPNGARLGTRALPVIAASSDGQQLVVRAPSSRGIQVTQGDRLILTGNRDGTLYSWVFGPNDVGAPKGYRFGGDGGTLSRRQCPSGSAYLCDPDGKCACVDLGGASQQQMGLKTAQASGRNRSRVSRFTNVRRR